MVCRFEHQIPRISAYEIHEWIHDMLHASEAKVSMVQIDGPDSKFSLSSWIYIMHMKVFRCHKPQPNINTPVEKCQLSE